MSWRDRPYAGDSGDPEIRIQFRRPGTAVTWLIIANVVCFFLTLIFERTGVLVDRLFGLSLEGIKSGHFWQPLTYMFVHADVWHILMNMLGLYIFGSEFERGFGRQRFLQFYGICGLVGGVAYLVMGALKPMPYEIIPLVGASGAVYGLLVACIIFFPHVQVVLIIFPMPIRVFGLIVAAIAAVQVLTGNVSNPGGQVCHLAGAATAMVIFSAWGIMPGVRIGPGRGLRIPFLGRRRSRRAEGAWERRQRRLAQEQTEVDRILAKVHDHGLNSLTWTERRTLSRATQRQKKREDELDRVDRL